MVAVSQRRCVVEVPFSVAHFLVHFFAVTARRFMADVSTPGDEIFLFLSKLGCDSQEFNFMGNSSTFDFSSELK